MSNTKNKWAEIDLAALKHNIKEVQRLAGSKVTVMAIVKAEAYGHGMVEISKTCFKTGIRVFGVATVEEGVALRKRGLGSLILVLYHTPKNKLKTALKYDLSLSFYEKDMIDPLVKAAKELGKKALVHLAVDTGMSWYGLSTQETVPFAKAVKTHPQIIIEGLYSHVSQADSEDPLKTYARKQFQTFEKVVKELKSEGIDPKFKHMANSAGIIGLKDSHINMVRPGLMLYGLYPAGVDRNKVNLKPVLSFKTKVVQVRSLPSGTQIGYGGTHTLRKDSRIAILPIGYSDGLSRTYSNNGEVLIKGQRAPVIGNICMNITMADVSHIENVKKGDIVTLIGRDKDEFIGADEAALKRGTISYEVLTNVGMFAPKVYKKGRK